MIPQHISRNQRVSVELGHASGTVFTGLTRWLLLAALLISPWGFGGIPANFVFFITCAVGIAAVCRVVDRSVETIPTGLMVPVALMPLLIAFLIAMGQITPVPLSWLEDLSPRAFEFWQSANAFAAAPIESGTVSLYPASTRHDAALLITATIAFWLAAHVFVSDKDQKTLWLLLAINGAALAVFGIVQQMTWNGKLYWTVQPEQVNNAFGPYVHHSHAASLISMCLAGAVGLLAIGVRSARSDGPASARTNSTDQTPAAQGSAVFFIFILALAGTMLAGILCSLSRSAVVGIAGAVAVTVAAATLVDRRPGLLIRLALIVAAGIGGIVYLGTASGVRDRLATLLTQDLKANARIQHWQDALRVVPDFFRSGSGLGTYRYVYPLYETRAPEELFFHAENQYVEALVEAGPAGLGLLLAVIGLMSIALYHSLRNDRSPAGRGLTLAAIFALTSQVLHACFDFALYLPANMLLLSVICGAAVGRAARVGTAQRSHALVALPLIQSRTAIAIVMIGLLAESAYAVTQTHATRVAVETHRTLKREFARSADSVFESEATLMRYEDRLRACRGNLELQMLAAECWSELYSRRVSTDLVGRIDQQTAAQIAEMRRKSRPEVLLALARNDRLDGNRSRVATIRDSEIVQSTLRPSADYRLTACLAAPVQLQNHVKLSRLRYLFSDLQSDFAEAYTLEPLGPFDSEAWCQSGWAHLLAGRNGDAFRCWKVWLGESGSLDAAVDVLNVADLQEADNGDLEAILPENPTRLMELARYAQRHSTDRSVNWESMILDHAAVVIERSRMAPAEKLRLKADLLILQGDAAGAITTLTRAVGLEPRNTDQRLELARLMERHGMIDQAIDQLAICRQLQPRNETYRTVLNDLSHRQTEARFKSPMRGVPHRKGDAR